MIYRDFGKAGFIGISSHNTKIALEAVKSCKIEVLMFPVNPLFNLLPQDSADARMKGRAVAELTADEKAADPAKEDTGLFYFKGEPGDKFAVCNAGGGFAYVGAMHDSFPPRAGTEQERLQRFCAHLPPRRADRLRGFGPGYRVYSRARRRVGGA